MSKHVNGKVSAKLNEDEWKSLESSCSKVQRLIGTKLVSSEESNINGNVTLKAGQDICFEGGCKLC